MTNKKNGVLRILSIVLCIVFFSFLAFFAFADILSEDKAMSDSENRVLTQFPELSIDSVLSGKFMSRFENYLSDQTVFRNISVAAQTVFSRILGKTEINDVYTGRDNRLFEVPANIKNENVNKTLEAVNSFADNSGIENRFFILAPNSSEIYTDELPWLLNLPSQEQQICEIYSKTSEKYITVDSVNALRNCRETKNLYFRTDHHWTADAAFLVFDEFMKSAEINYDKLDYEEFCLSNTFFGTLSSSSGIYERSDELKVILPKGIDGKYYVYNYDTQEKSVSVLVESKLSSKNQYEVFFGGNFGRIEILSDNMNDKRILILKDSYANCFIPLLIPHFEKIVIIDPRYFNGNLQYILEDNDFSHLLLLYNLNTFVEDTSVVDLLK